MVPLVQGMPVALTDHVDRSLGKQLLRGKFGTFHLWVLDEKDSSVLENGEQIFQTSAQGRDGKVSRSRWQEGLWALPGLE